MAAYRGAAIKKGLPSGLDFREDSAGHIITRGQLAFFVIGAFANQADPRWQRGLYLTNRT